MFITERPATPLLPRQARDPAQIFMLLAAHGYVPVKHEAGSALVVDRHTKGMLYPKLVVGPVWVPSSIMKVKRRLPEAGREGDVPEFCALDPKNKAIDWAGAIVTPCPTPSAIGAIMPPDTVAPVAMNRSPG
jgi:hypothetical protein